MTAFPTLTDQPDGSSFEQEAAIDPTQRSEFENGKVQTRSRFTTVPEKFSFVYRGMSQADQTALAAFEKTVNYGAGSFDWLHPRTAATHVVRFAKPIKFSIEPRNPSTYKAVVEVIEV